jgi:hypothetical protein
MSSTAISDSNTYFGMFGFATAAMWFDTTIFDTDAYLQDLGGPGSGSVIQIPSGLNGLYTITLRVAITATTPLVAASRIFMSMGDSSQPIEFDLGPDMISGQVDTWLFNLTGLAVMDNFDVASGGFDLTTLINPAIYTGGDYYTSFEGVYHGTP